MTRWVVVLRRLPAELVGRTLTLRRTRQTEGRSGDRPRLQAPDAAVNRRLDRFAGRMPLEIPRIPAGPQRCVSDVVGAKAIDRARLWLAECRIPAPVAGFLQTAWTALTDREREREIIKLLCPQYQLHTTTHVARCQKT